MEAEREENIDEERSLEEKEEAEKREKDEQPDIDLTKDQDAPGADIEKYTNFIRDYRDAIEKLDHLINTLKSSISAEDKAEVEEQIIDARKYMIAAKKRVYDYRLKLGAAAPSSEGETIDALNEQYETAMDKVKEVLKKKE